MAGADSLMKKGIPQRMAFSFEEMGITMNTSDPQVTGREVIGRKIGKLIREEGKTPSQAAGQAFGQARGGDLGSAARREAGRRPPR